MERKYFKDIGYKPFLFYIIFGVSGEDLEVSRKKHKVDELPEGLDIRTFTREAHGEWIDGWFTGTYGSVLKNADASLFEICQNADICTVLQGEIKNDATLDYMRNVIGIIQAFIDKGALGILDPQTITMYSPDQWTDRFFDKEVNAQNHVIILSSEENEGYWLHTRGMAEFGRPDIGISCVPEDKIHDYTQLINQMIYYGGQGVFFENDTRLHTSDGKTFVVHPEFVNDFDNDDYNNAYYNVTLIEDVIMEDKINSIKEIINSWDPIELFPMAPSNEYEYEIYEISKYIHTNKCIQRKELAEYIYDIFIKSFGDDVFLLKQSDCLIIADEILNLNA